MVLVQRQGRTTNPSHFKGAQNLPVETVSWEDCQDFIKRLREKDKKSYRLPTEAEWEYACRAGTTTPFHFGDVISTDKANYQSSFIDGIFGHNAKGVYRERTTPVGSFPANTWGLHDMHGNVWEWCQDWTGDYSQKDVVDPLGPQNIRHHRVLRGGSWFNTADRCRSASRSGSEPEYRASLIGFRICLNLE
jgi:formylglycine-generating enzyme required for sulfatase activity